MQSPCFLSDNDPQRSGRFPVLIRVTAIFPTHTQDIHRHYGSMYAYWPEFMSTGCFSVMAVSRQRLFQPDMMIRQFSNEILYNEVEIIGYRHFLTKHDDVIKWKHFLHYWTFVQGIHRLTMNSLHIGQWRGALMFSFICIWINSWVNNREAGDLRRYRVHCDIIVMKCLW